jgi:hypothetical protein
MLNPKKLHIREKLRPDLLNVGQQRIVGDESVLEHNFLLSFSDCPKNKKNSPIEIQHKIHPAKAKVIDRTLR